MSIPLLAPHALLAWREAGHLIIEDPAAPQSQVLVGNANEEVARWLRSCDGTRSLDAVIAAAPGIDAASARALLEALADAGLLALGVAEALAPAIPSAEARSPLGQDLDALALCGRDAGAAFTRRQEHHIWIEGVNRVAHALVEVLAASHVGSLQVRGKHLSRRPIVLRDVGAFGPQAADVGEVPTIAMRRHIERARLRARVDVRRPVVIACDAHLDPSEEVGYQEAGVPYLRVLATSRYATIGPLTLPGHTACWSCLALHRSDADPEWPRLLAQFEQSRRSLAPIDNLFAMWVASEAASRLLEVIDSDDPASLVNCTWHIDRAAAEVRRRRWRVHPDCPCQWRGAAQPRSSASTASP